MAETTEQEQHAAGRQAGPAPAPSSGSLHLLSRRAQTPYLTHGVMFSFLWLFRFLELLLSFKNPLVFADGCALLHFPLPGDKLLYGPRGTLCLPHTDTGGTSTYDPSCEPLPATVPVLQPLWAWAPESHELVLNSAVC